MIKTVLGNIADGELGITLPHEHICCFSEYLYKMSAKSYLDKENLLRVASSYLKEMKKSYNLSSFIDCTPVNIGRDIELLKQVSESAEINIVCSTGFYYTDEPVMYSASSDYLCKHIVADAVSVNAGIIKCAVESEKIGPFQEKLLRACAKAQLYTGLPMVLHTNAKNKNALPALEMIFFEGVKPQAVTVGHLSDTNDTEYIKCIAKLGCFIGFDRLYDHADEEYVTEKVSCIDELCNSGYEDQIILSHDALFFNGFGAEPEICEKPRYSFVFEHVLPRLKKGTAEKIMVQNPVKMLKVCEI